MTTRELIERIQAEDPEGTAPVRIFWPPEIVAEVERQEQWIVLLTETDARRRRGMPKRREKDWNACPYSAHTDDCACGGTGGDR